MQTPNSDTPYSQLGLDSADRADGSGPRLWKDWRTDIRGFRALELLEHSCARITGGTFARGGSSTPYGNLQEDAMSDQTDLIRGTLDC